MIIGMLRVPCTANSYSCRADVFMPDGYGSKPIVWSPDHTKHVQLWSTPENAEADEGVFSLSIHSRDKLLKTITLQDLSAATFIKWSPDSKAFYVMWSNGGATGGYEVRVFIVEKDEAVESPAPQAVADDFAKRHYCQARGNNLYAVRWVQGSAELEMRPEVYPTGDCAPDAGLSAEYVVNTATGKMVERGQAKEMTPFTEGCPSDIFPTAFTTQKQIEDYRKSNDYDLPKH